jgi:DNA (cytosine-5)-methyltransferase 1
MRVLDLFSGIGGFSLGLERAGMETVAFCEFDKKAQLVLKKHWPEIPIYDDVRELSGKQFEGQTIDLICGGFPCQPFSVAGKQKGEEDDRHLWPEYFRLIQEIRPRWVIGENVSGLINMGLDQVLSDLESADYSCQTLVIPACAVNAPHRRDRVWIIANSESARAGENIGRLWQGVSRISGGENAIPKTLENTGHRGRGDGIEGSPRGNGTGKLEAGLRATKAVEVAGSGEGVEALAHSKCFGQTHSEYEGQPRHQKGLLEGSGIEPKDVAHGFDNGGQGWEGHWDIEPSVGRVANGIPHRVDRLKQLGNAVVPQIVEVIGRTIMEAENPSNFRRRV